MTVGIVLEEPTGVCRDCGAAVDIRAVLAGDEEKGSWATAEDGSFLMCIPSPGACDACGGGNVALRMTPEQRRAHEDLTRALRRHWAAPRSPDVRDTPQRTLNDDDLSTPAGRRRTAKMMADGIAAALRPEAREELICLVMDDGDRLARLVGRHVAQGAGKAYEPQQPGQIHGRPAPLSTVLQVREELGDRLVRGLEAPLAPGKMRVLILAPSQRHVVDVQPDADHLVAVEEVDAPRPASRDISGTWKDPVRYLPLPLPEDWVLGGRDHQRGLQVVVGGAIELYIGAFEPHGGRALAVQVRRAAGDREVSDAEAGALLEQLQNVGRGFVEIRGADLVPEGSRLYGSVVHETAWDEA